jgi:hypothetical protein
MEPPLIDILLPDLRTLTTLEPLRPKQMPGDRGGAIPHLDSLEWESSVA